MSISKRFDDELNERDDERKLSGRSSDETSAVAPTKNAFDLSQTSRGVTNGRRESIEPKKKNDLKVKHSIQIGISSKAN